ncbi:MAG: polysaccharide biosynthesis/export family protein [Sphingomonas sp.]
MSILPSRSYRLAGTLGGALMLAGCATLPASGPTAGQIVRGARPAQNTLGFRLVDIDPASVAEAATIQTASDGRLPTLATLAAEGRNDVVGAGDVLTINIYEVGATLFGGARQTSDAFDPSARGEAFPAVPVDKDGTIKLPYIGRLQVAGRTPGEIQGMIERGLSGKSQSPQALVTIRTNVSNTVFVGGDVRRPGRLELSLQRERLLDAVASAGGAANSSEDTVVRFNRGARTVEERLGRIRSGAVDDLVLVPGDRIELIKRPRSFIVLGATTRVSQVAFETGDLSLAEAVARAGGPNDNTADPSAVFVFRYDPQVDGAAAVPVVYRLNLMKPASYFLSQRFAMRDKDVIYIGNAAANQPAKLVGIINQLFTPFVTARVLTNNN